MINLKDIRKAYKTNQVLKGVDLDINPGCIQALLGANGAGKTTLVNIVACILEADNGELFIDNERITIDSYGYRRKIGYVFEQPMYIDKLTPYEYLSFVGKMYGIDKQQISNRVDELLEFFGLEEDDNYIEKLSKGMKSKVSLAAALIHNPKYLILDEPFDGVDFLSVQKITRLFRSLTVKGCTILITSHQYDIIAGLCDRFALLKDGKILFNQTFSELETAAKDSKDSNGNPISVKQYIVTLMDDDISNRKALSWV
ncbi:MAG TPA: ABC transporter [Bacteroidales bacterium]|nr:ABC transporter [Bacteroidales bacterium]